MKNNNNIISFLTNISDNINESNKNNTLSLNTNSLKKRKYNSAYRKKLVTQLETIKQKDNLIDIYNIIINDIGNNFSSNVNGIFININILSDNCINNLIEYINNNSNNNNNNLNGNKINDKINCNIYKLDDIDILSEMGYKLNNHEKNIIKRIHFTKYTNFI